MASQQPEQEKLTMTSRRFGHLAVLVIGLALGMLAHATLFSGSPSAIAQSQTPAPSLQEELEAIRGKLPDQSHTMQDVAYHYANLWFAGQKENWALANFYWSETRSHLHWAVRIIPVRKDNAGTEIKLAEILEAMENGPLKQLGESIEGKDQAAFEKAYRTTLESCYACHKAADKPFLRPQIPSAPEAPIMDFDPDATWPR
jgi:hypothetical protein